MASQEGIDYFPLDTGFLRDKKVLLIKGKYGAKGILILVYILCRIYEEHGYYIKWDEDDCFLSADAIGCGVSPELTTQVVNECVVRSMFDEQLYNEFGILTSHGIQKRFVRAAKKRENIEFYQEYFLLDTSNLKDVPRGILNKLTFLSAKASGNEEKASGNCKKASGRRQSKVKESTVKETKVNKEISPALQGSPTQEAVFLIPLIDGSVHPVYPDDVAKYRTLYPAVDVNQEFRKMIGWTDSHPDNRKTKRGIGKFINGWISRAQDSARPARAEAAPPKKNQFHNFEQRDTDYDSLVLERLQEKLGGG